MRRFLMLLLLTTGALAQSTTTVTGTVKDLSAAVVTSGQITFDLRPGLDTTISGAARFVPSTITCTINGSGLIKALDGVSACIVTQNTSLTPNGTYYKVCIQPYSITPGSCFNWYALASTFDITTAVPTPATAPAFTFLDLITTQTISGVKTFTAVPVLSAGISGTLGQTLGLPALADTLVGRISTDTLTNKTLTAPVVTNPSTTGTDSGAETLVNKTLTSPAVSNPTIIGMTQVGRLRGTQGTAQTSGNIAISAGWGASATVTGVLGTDTALYFLVNSAGAGTAAGPTVAITFADGTFTNPPVCIAMAAHGSTAANIGWVESSVAATSVTFQATQISAAFTPSAGQSYGVNVLCVGK